MQLAESEIHDIEQLAELTGRINLLSILIAEEEESWNKDNYHFELCILNYLITYALNFKN